MNWVPNLGALSDLTSNTLISTPSIIITELSSSEKKKKSQKEKGELRMK